MTPTTQLPLDFRHVADLKPGDGVRVHGRILRVGPTPGTYVDLHGEPFVPKQPVRSVERCPAYNVEK